jgi:flavin reductase (DIM6/NTAB) family NADH-FMN oxidoreductase RutF
VALDEKAKRSALRMLPHPVFLVGCAFEGNHHVFVGTWLTQVSFKPPLVAFACRKESGSHEMIRKSGIFSINILGGEQADVAKAFLKGATFSGTTVNGYEFTTNGSGAPLLADAAAVLECRVVQETEGGDHRVFIGEVEYAKSRREERSLSLEDTGLQYGG